MTIPQKESLNERTKSVPWYRKPATIVTAVLLLSGIAYMVWNGYLKEQKTVELAALENQLNETTSLYVDLHRKTRDIAFSMEPLRRRLKDAEESLNAAKENLQDSKSKLETIRKEPLVVEYLQKKEQLQSLRQENETLRKNWDSAVKEYKDFQNKAYE